MLGATSQLIVFLAEPSHDETIDRLLWIADHPDRANVAKLFDVLAMPFLFGVVIVYVLLSRQRSPRLAYAGGILLGCGMVGLTAARGFETLEFALAGDSTRPPVPRGAILLIPLFILMDFFLQMGVLGHAIALAAACWIASSVLLAGRTTAVA